MENPARSGLRFKKILLVLLSLSVLLVAIIIVSTFLFLRSRAFAPFVEKALTKSLGQSVEIRSISLEGWNVIHVKGVTVKEANSTIAAIDRADISLSLSGLLSRRVDNIYIKKPVFFLKPRKGRTPVKGGSRGALPVFFKNITVKDGTVIIVNPGKEKSFTLGPVNLSLHALSKKKAAFSGDIFLPALGSKVTLSAGLDMERLAIDHGRVDISSVELKNLSAGNMSLFKGAGLKGSLKAGLDIRKKGDGLEAELKIAFKDLHSGRYKNRGKASGVLSALFKLPGDFHRVDTTLTLRARTTLYGRVTRYRALLKGTYTFKGGRLRIKEATLSSPGLGSLGLKGNFGGIGSRDPSVKINLKVKNLSLAGLAKTLAGLLPAGMEYHGVLKGAASAAGSFSKGIRWQSGLTLTGLATSGGPLGVNLEKRPLTVTARGDYNRNKGDILNIKSFKAGITGFGRLLGRGSLKQISTKKPQMDLRVRGRDILIGPAPGVLSVSGGAARMLKGVSLRGLAGFGITIKGTTSSPLVRGGVSVEGKRIKTKNADVRNFLFRAPVIGYKNSTLTIKKIILKAESVGLKREGVEVYTARKVLIKGGLSGDLERRIFRAKGFSFKTGELTGAAEDVSLSLKNPVKAHAEVGLKGLDIEKIWPQAIKYLHKGDGIEAQGRLQVHSTLDAALTGKKGGLIKGRVDLGISGGGFSTSDGTVAGDGFNIGGAGKFETTLPDLSTRFDVNARAKDFELLAGDFYGDFTKTPLNISLTGDYSRADNSVKIARSEVSLKGVGEVLMNGKISNPGVSPAFNTRISVRKLSNKKIFGLFVRDTFQETFPLLSRIDIDGVTSLDISAGGSLKEFNAHGRLILRDVNVRGTDEDEVGPSVLGLNLDLPVEIFYPEPGPMGDGRDKKYGSLKIKKISWGAVNFHGLKAAPAIRQNSLIFADDLILSIFGGSVRLGGLSYKNLLSPERRLSLSIRMDKIDLREASTALGLPPFNGRLSGTIPEADLTKGTLRTKGEITLNLFGGEMLIKKMAAEDILSPAAAFKATVELKDIDMGQVTGTFEFGHITGILQGYVRDLEIVNGQPEAFVVKMETVKRRGVSQRISTRALEKISILGTGGTASVLNRGIYRLFKEYRYDKMGFKGRLKNDKFLLLGIETEGDKGYIIKGGFLPPKVDVISYTQNISFKELVGRLKRINVIGGGG